jgi:hypothetical protein
MVRYLIHPALMSRTTPPARRESERDLLIRLAAERRRDRSHRRRRDALRRFGRQA